jgi:hypothetical protein
MGLSTISGEILTIEFDLGTSVVCLVAVVVLSYAAIAICLRDPYFDAPIEEVSSWSCNRHIVIVGGGGSVDHVPTAGVLFKVRMASNLQRNDCCWRRNAYALYRYLIVCAIARVTFIIMIAYIPRFCLCGISFQSED